MKANKIILSMAVAAALPFSAMATQTIVQTQTPAAVGANGTVKKAATSGPYVTSEPTAADQTHIATTAYVKGAYNDAIAAVNKVDSDLRNNLSDEISDLGTYINDELESVGERISGIDSDIFDLQSDLADKQNQLVNFDTHSNMGTNVVGAADEAIGVLHSYQGNMDVNTTLSEMLPVMEQDYGIDYSASLITAEAAIKLAAILSEYKQQKLSTTVNNQSQDMSSTIAQTVNTTTPSATTLVSEAAIAGAINGVTTNLSTNYATNSALNSKRVTVYTTWGVDDGTAVTQVPFSTAQ